MQGLAVGRGAGDRTLTRANIFGYVGSGGARADAVFRAAQRELRLAPLQPVPTESSTGEAVFAFCRADARAVSHASDEDGSFVAVVGNPYGLANAEELLAVWLAEGIAAFDDLDFHGYVAAWNAASAELVLVRDKFGVESGYYARTESGSI